MADEDPLSKPPYDVDDAARAERLELLRLDHGRGQIGEPELGTLRERYRALDRVLELAHVAGPGVAVQGRAGLGGESLASAFAAGCALQELLGEQRHDGGLRKRRRSPQRAIRYYILYTMYWMLYTMYYKPGPMCPLLYTIDYILHTARFTLLAKCCIL